MAQTTGGFTGKNFKIELSTNGSSWTDCSGIFNEVQDASSTRESGEVLTPDTDYPIVSTGKRGALKPKFKFVYTETAGEPYQLARAAHENDTLLYVRWSSKSGSTGQERHSCSGYVTDFPYPSPSATNKEVMTAAFTMITPVVTTATVP